MFKKYVIALVAVTLFSVITTCSQQQQQQQTEQDVPTSQHPNTTSDWENLFSSDLANATYPEGEWMMEEGVLEAEGHGTIWTEESYEDFVLDLEFRVEPGANSGIFFRTKDKNNILSALEVQIHDSTDGTKHGQMGAIYDIKSPSEDATKPAGEWQQLTLTSNENMIYVILNGTQIIEMNLNDWDTAGENPQGTTNKFDRVLAEQTYGGPIGFQGIHGEAGAKVYFRDLKIKSLN